MFPATAAWSVPLAGAAVVLGLVGLFKLMNQFEIHRPPPRRPSSEA